MVCPNQVPNKLYRVQKLAQKKTQSRLFECPWMHDGIWQEKDCRLDRSAYPMKLATILPVYSRPSSKAFLLLGRTRSHWKSQRQRREVRGDLHISHQEKAVPIHTQPVQLRFLPSLEKYLLSIKLVYKIPEAAINGRNRCFGFKLIPESNAETAVLLFLEVEMIPVSC